MQGYFGGLTDLIFQRIIEIWGATPSLYIIIIVAAIWQMNFWLLVGLIGAVRLDRARRSSSGPSSCAPATSSMSVPRKALGVADRTIIFRHVLPNAMVATVTFLPFTRHRGTIGSLAALDFLGFGLPSNAPSLGELTLAGQAEPAGAVAGLYRVLRVRPDAVA